jgi:hypothetical protein
MLTHLAVDTEALMSNGWPTPSADLENLVASCHALGIPVLLSQITLTEIETIWLERTGDRLSKAKGLLESLQRDFDGLVPNVVVPTPAGLRDAYRAAVDRIRGRWNWQLAGIVSIFATRLRPVAMVRPHEARSDREEPRPARTPRKPVACIYTTAAALFRS